MTDDSGHQLIDELADEFLTSCLRGLRPEIDDYCDAYPWIASEIRQLFPMLQFLESNKDQRGSFVAPDVIGPYQIITEIGRGGMGIVYEAQRDGTGERVALKVLRPENDQIDSSMVSRFEREAEAVSKIDHPNVVRLIECGEVDGFRFIAMQLIAGSSLDRIIRLFSSAYRSNADRWFESVMHHVTDKQSSFAVSDYFAWVIRVGVHTAQALHHAHESGVLHRDVKPSNLLVDRSGNVWLTDFGLAKTGEAKLTRTGQIIGTLRYLAPERLRGACDLRSDIYGLGLTLYELLTFRSAFDEDDRLSLVANIEHLAPTPPRKIMPSVPRELERIVMRALAKQAKRRYSSAAKMAQALQSCDLSATKSNNYNRH